MGLCLATVCMSQIYPMPMVIALVPSITKNAAVAYIHYLSFMLCFAALILERKLIKPDIDRTSAISMVVTDVVYGIAGLTLLISGILRVIYFGQGTEFYTQNPVFWWKVGIFLFVGVLSLYPTITYISWAIPLSKGQLPEMKSGKVFWIGWLINVEIFGFALIPLLATLMARGVGLNSQ